MTDFEPEEDLPPVAHVIMVYNGPVAPHWEMKVRYGDQKMLDEFWTRVNARLLLLPKHDPQFRRNRERVNRDAERELIICDWDLGEDDAETTSTPTAVPVQAEAPAEEAAEEATEADAPVEADPVSEDTADPIDAADPVDAADPGGDGADPEPEAVEDVATEESDADVVEETEAAAGQA